MHSNISLICTEMFPNKMKALISVRKPWGEIYQVAETLRNTKPLIKFSNTFCPGTHD